MKFTPNGGLIRVPTWLHGPAGAVIAGLALDTAATRSVVSWGLALLAGYDPSSSSQRLQLTTGSGVEFVPEVSFDRIVALGHDRLAFPLICHTLPPSSTVDGILGLDFFAGMKLVVDFRGGDVFLE